MRNIDILLIFEATLTNHTETLTVKGRVRCFSNRYVYRYMNVIKEATIASPISAFRKPPESLRFVSADSHILLVALLSSTSRAVRKETIK